MVKTHDGWKFFQGINKDRLKQGKIDEVKIYNKIKELDKLHCQFEPTKAWNNQIDYYNQELNVSLEIKRRFLNSTDEYPFNKMENTISTIITFKKYKHLLENNGWLFIQYNDCLFMLEVNKLKEEDFKICYPFRVKHISINLSCCEIISNDRYE